MDDLIEQIAKDDETPLPRVPAAGGNDPRAKLRRAARGGTLPAPPYGARYIQITAQHVWRPATGVPVSLFLSDDDIRVFRTRPSEAFGASRGEALGAAPQAALVKMNGLVESTIKLARRALLSIPVLDFESVLENAKQLGESGQLERGLDLVYEYFDALLTGGRFNQCDAVLRGANPEELTIDIALTILTVTLPAAHVLNARVAFFQRVELWLRETGTFEEALLSGLEG